MAIEVTARDREGQVCPYCRDRLAGAADELFECPGCVTRTHAACRREAGRCTTAGCTGPPPGAAAEVARSRRAARGKELEPEARRDVEQLRRGRPERVRLCVLVATVSLVASCLAIFLGYEALGFTLLGVGFTAGALGALWVGLT